MLALDASPHQWEISVALADDRDREARALFSVLGRAHGLEAIAGSEEFARPDEAIATLANASHIPKPQQLQVLAKVARESSTDDSLVQGVGLDAWADTLLQPALVSDRDSARAILLERLQNSVPGQDPLGRTDISELLDPLDPPDPLLPFDPDHFLHTLDLDIGATMLQLLPSCDDTTTKIEGYLALSISTRSLTRKRFSAFESIVDPCRWPRCWLQAWFFRAMEFVRPPQGPPGAAIPDPEDGWEATLEEVVDWSLGFGPPDTMRTELDFRYVWPEAGASAGQLKRGACTYDLARSVDGRVKVDQGYLLVEDLRPKYDVRRFQTLKQVFLTNPPVKVGSGDLCGFWSFVSGLIQQGC